MSYNLNHCFASHMKMHRIKCAQLENNSQNKTNRWIERKKNSVNKTNRTSDSHSRRLHKTWNYIHLVANGSRTLSHYYETGTETKKKKKRETNQAAALVFTFGIVLSRFTMDDDGIHFAFIHIWWHRATLYHNIMAIISKLCAIVL